MKKSSIVMFYDSIIIAEYIWFLVVMDKSCFYKNKDVVVTESGVRTHAVNDYQKSHQFFR